MTRIEQIGDATLYLGDCRDILPTIEGIDAIVTDPPYGIGITKSNRLSISRGFLPDSWDDETPDLSILLNVDCQKIIWGGNYFPLPPTRCVLAWDKNNAGRDFADFELAWTNLDQVARRIVQRPMNMDGGKLHPTQKPVEVMRWCISFLKGNELLICDPFMGSGTTACAAFSLGHKFIGIEREEKYFDIACKRIEKAQRQQDLFVHAPINKPTQEAMF